MLLSYKNFSVGIDAPNDQFDNNNDTYTSSERIVLPTKNCKVFNSMVQIYIKLIKNC